ncbi:hypothetical protein BVRB_5g126740 [Beta vulgaris subsp. vulgaris]|uniref:Uncharacterized protein n=1 Tax=Beta vulgaris subsp. vulgaris TaxID=3555 RepID=A0A0J8E303_BETVV|nr:hypothetical protein BVRB_5g126740 [Beta vulgaris subsp. vulgaris]
MNLTNGRMKVETQEDIDRIANGRDKYNRVDIYVIMENTLSTRSTTSTRPNTSSRPNVLASVKTEKTKPEKKAQMSPHRKSPKFATNLSDPDVILLGHEWDKVNIPQTCREPLECKNTPPLIPKTVKATKFEPPKSAQQVPPSPPKKITSKIDLTPQHQPLASPEKGTQSRRKHVAKKRKNGNRKGKRKVDEEWSGEENWSSDSEWSDIGVEFDPDEEVKATNDDDVFTLDRPKDITQQVGPKLLSRIEPSRSIVNGTQEASTSHNVKRRAPTPKFKPTNSATTSNVEPSQSSQAPHHRAKLQVKPKKNKKLEDIDG